MGSGFRVSLSIVAAAAVGVLPTTHSNTSNAIHGSSTIYEEEVITDEVLLLTESACGAAKPRLPKPQTRKPHRLKDGER